MVIIVIRLAEGTPAYLPPDILSAAHRPHVDHLADAWALGCVAYFCSAGKPLFFGSAENVSERDDDEQDGDEHDDDVCVCVYVCRC